MMHGISGKKGQTRFLIGASLALLVAPAPLMAQSTNASEANSTESGNDIVVTATRREQRLQDVPLAVTAVSGADLAQSNFREASDIQYLAPSVTFSSTNPVANGGGYQVRGVGTQTYDGGVEQTVALVVDGVTVALPRDPGVSGFSDIDRVEVLRGPQGTLFGKNASAGVIHLITRNPVLGQYSGNVSLSYGERQEIIGRTTVNIPLGDTLAFRGSAYYSRQDGAIPYLLHAGNVGDRENWGVRAKLLFEPSDGVSFVLTGEYQHAFARDSATIDTLGRNPRYNALFARFAVKPGPDSFVAYDDGDWRANTTMKGVSLQANIGLGEHTLTSITAYRETALTQLADIDHTPINIFNNSDGGINSHQFSQELRIASPSGGRFEYVAGLYYLGTNIDGWTTQKGDFLKFITGLPFYPPAVIYGERLQHNETSSYAAFASGTFNLTDTLSFIGGLRYTNDHTRGSLRVLPVPGYLSYGTLLPYSGRVSADNVSGRAGLQFQPNRNLMVYGTYSTGYKGPAIDSLNGNVVRVRPETVESYEAGVKSTLMDGHLTLNLSVFQADYKNFQAQALDMTSGTPRLSLANAGLLRTRGFEVEAALRPVRGVNFSANVAYNDAKFKDYTGACYTGQPVSTVTGVGCYLLPGTTGTYVANYAGDRLSNAPKWSYGVRGSVEQAIGGGLKMDANATWSWRQSVYSINGDPNSRVPSYGIVNANIGIGGENGNWRIGVYARNLFDRHFYGRYPALPNFNTGGYERVISPDAFRTIGVTLTGNF
jgi:iron complex outermembrane receptor protein